MAALFLCSAACLPRRWAIGLPFIILLGTDFFLNWQYTQTPQLNAVHREFTFFTMEMLVKTLAFAAIAVFGWQLRKQTRPKVLIPAAIGSSLFFYFVTNTASWLSDPGYGPSLASWTQALTIGLPGYIPTWMFCRNALVADVLFTGLFLACLRVRAPHPEAKPAPAAAW